MGLGRPSKAALNKNRSLTLARQVRLGVRNTSAAVISPPTTDVNNVGNQDAANKSSGDEVECTGWSGGVTHCISSDEEQIDASGDNEVEEVEELSGSELEEVIQRNRERFTGKAAIAWPVARATERLPAMLKATVQQKSEPSPFSDIMGKRTNREWKKAENTRSLGYSGHSARTRRRQEKAMRDKEAEDAKLREG